MRCVYICVFHYMFHVCYYVLSILCCLFFPWMQFWLKVEVDNDHTKTLTNVSCTNYMLNLHLFVYNCVNYHHLVWKLKKLCHFKPFVCPQIIIQIHDHCTVCGSHVILHPSTNMPVTLSQKAAWRNRNHLNIKRIFLSHSTSLRSFPARPPDSIKLFVVTVLWEEPISPQHSAGLCGVCHGDPPGSVWLIAPSRGGLLCHDAEAN